jgi:CHAT domain-containing protein
MLKALQVNERAWGTHHLSTAETLSRLGYLEAQNQNLALAEQYFNRAVLIREQILGTQHRDLAASLLELARAKHAQGKLSDARPLYERARLIIEAQAGNNPGLDDEALARIWKRDVKGLQDYALLLAMLARTSKASREQQSAVADGFTVTQQARGWLMQAAVAKALALKQSGSQTEVTLVRRVDDLRRRRQELWNRLNEFYALADDQRDAAELATTKLRLLELQQELDRATLQLRSVAPRYAETAQPEAQDLVNTQRLLRPGEALVSFYTLGDRVQIWAVRHEQTTMYRETPIDRDKLLKLVQQLRLSLVPKAHPSTGESVLMAYDVESAATLFQMLFQPVRSALTDVEHLILVPDDTLLPLPFAALLTQRDGDQYAHLAQLYRHKQLPSAADFADYATLPWLAKSYPITVLPSATALKLLRQYAIAGTNQSEPFLGFGDPMLHGKGSQLGGKMVASRGMRVAVDSLRELDSLPGTRQELLAVASVLHVNPDTALFLGERATETEVRRLNASGRLGQAKVVSFATHGLLAGEVQGVTQPALVLTPPDAPTEDNDGLLSMEDVLQLKLPKSDWVILSACNTAGDDGSGESLSGLARAFFFAGAKSLLVSQWSVDDEATRELMTAIFTRYSAEDSVSQAKALQKSMLSLLDQARKDPQKRYFAHPFAWAAFFLVGDGASKR